MAQQLSPWLEGAYGWNFGEGGWNSGMDSNLLKFSFMFDRNVDSIVTSLPPAINGQAHYLTTDNRLYFAVGTTYFSTLVPKWFTIYVRTTGQTHQFDGTSLVQTYTPAQLESRLNAVELTVASLGTAAFQNIEFFATQAELDVAAAQANDYTDAALFVKQIDSVATLTTAGSEGRFNNDRANLLGYFSNNPGVGGGELYWDATSTATPDNGTIFQVAGVVTGRWKRLLGADVFLEWFGIVGDGITLEDSKVRAAVAATPDGGTLHMPTREITVLLDIPSGQSSRWQSAANFNKPGMRVLGSHACVFKLQDFTSAWVAYSGITALTAFRVGASDVEVIGLNIDANADNHYELDGGGFKFWETGPLNKRPANGITVSVDDDAPNVVGVRIKNCKIDRPVAGCYASGNLSIVAGTSLDDPDFFNGSLATNVVEDVQFIGNEVRNARGNDYVFIAGVRDSVAYDNDSFNSMYHQCRIYAGVTRCHFRNNRAHVDYAEIAARWNETDLGYWRSNNPAVPAQYLIQRTGMTIGSSSVNTSANGGNITRCGLYDNIVEYTSNTIDGGIVDVDELTLASFFSWNVNNGITISGNKSINSPFMGLCAVISVAALNPTAHGVLFSGNEVINCRRQGVYTLGAGIVFTENKLINCGIDGNGLPLVYIQGGSRVFKNTAIWQKVGEVNANNIFEVVAYGPSGAVFVSDNVTIGYTGTRMLNAGAIVVHGTDGGGVPLTLLAGWTAGPEPVRITVDCAGRVSLEGYVNSAAGGTDTLASLNGVLVPYRPRDSQRFPVINSTGTVTLGLSTDIGSIAATRGALAAGTSFAVTAHWQSDFRV